MTNKSWQQSITKDVATLVDSLDCSDEIKEIIRSIYARLNEIDKRLDELENTEVIRFDP